MFIPMQSYQILLSYQRARKEVTSPLSPAFDIHLLTAKQPVVLTDHGFPNFFCYLKAMGSQKLRAIYFRFQQHSKPFGRIPQVKNSFWVTSGPQLRQIQQRWLFIVWAKHVHIIFAFSVAPTSEDHFPRTRLQRWGKRLGTELPCCIF